MTGGNEHNVLYYIIQLRLGSLEFLAAATYQVLYRSYSLML